VRNAAEPGPLESLLLLRVDSQEVDRLAARLRRTADEALESLNHVTLAPTASRLAPSHPDVAATLYRARGIRILAAKKRKYSDAAVSHRAQAKQGYERAGLEHEGQALGARVLHLHGWQYGFISGVDRVVRGGPQPLDASFLDRAQRRWWRSKSD
jgi:hypothetical protein